jgi:molecular chaperone Hsp33
MAEPDRVVRAMTMDGAFRQIAAVVTDTARAALATQATGDELGLRLAELIAAAVLVRETTQPTRRVQLVWRDRRGGSLVADSLPEGPCRGLVNPGESTAVLTEGDHRLLVNYTSPDGSPYQGVIGVPDGDDISTALMRYFKQSEQITAMVAIAALPGPGGVRAVGGYVVQLLPEATKEVIEATTDHLAGLEPIGILLEGRGRTAAALCQTVFEPFPYADLASSPIAFGCTCSQVRVMSSILTLPSEEVESMLSGDALEVRCDACGRNYRVEVEELRDFRDAGGPRGVSKTDAEAV